MGNTTSQTINTITYCDKLWPNFDEELIKTDHDYIAEVYCARDKALDLKSEDQILNSLIKLGYYNINTAKETNKFISKQLQKKILQQQSQYDQSFMSKTISQIKDDFIVSDEYIKFQDSLNRRVQRALTLSAHTHHRIISMFYKDLTIEELIYLGV